MEETSAGFMKMNVNATIDKENANLGFDSIIKHGRGRIKPTWSGIRTKSRLRCSSSPLALKPKLTAVLSWTKSSQYLPSCSTPTTLAGRATSSEVRPTDRDSGRPRRSPKDIVLGKLPMIGTRVLAGPRPTPTPASLSASFTRLKFAGCTPTIRDQEVGSLAMEATTNTQVDCENPAATVKPSRKAGDHPLSVERTRWG
nr:hypothetical protein Itr_chr13CG10370 [Ipomoea trifida]